MKKSQDIVNAMLYETHGTGPIQRTNNGVFIIAFKMYSSLQPLTADSCSSPGDHRSRFTI